ncbi:NAD-dependent succinate-semialdehyde dehydrogenase [Nocardia higoensis]|uniref:NAD-dependent succinate-semialdehyde dehydrogenase n=1 Tax=Nocardia higoensis TaxID=228599 RepID=UPI00031C347B|nr:NAD-dependent succinate-semialdehyde dehydrogenase [Nocardia higoensis]
MTVSPATFTVENPATLEIIDRVADTTPEDARAAVDRASDAFGPWSTASPRERAEVLRRTYELMIRDRDELARLISVENGKSLADAAAEVVYAAEFFRWFSEEAVRSGGDYGEAPAGGARTIVRHRPVGVAALVTPWNFPAAMPARKIAPALGAGCTAVLKPAEETPLTAFALAALMREAGLPVGALEVVATRDAPGVVTAWLTDRRVRKISFTGSTGVGRQLLHQAADRVVNASMELGGNAPFIVTEDADIEAAVAGAMIAKFRNAGQACTAANRFYVHADVAEQFVSRLGAEIERLEVGNAADGAVIGPLISAAAVRRVGKAVDDAVRDGARITHRSALPDAPGYFFPPTLLADVHPDAAILGEEIFGPVAPVVAWRDEAEMLSWADDTEYGLASYVFAGDVGRALRIGEHLEAGMVGINRGLVSDPSAPFGGIKQSGLGREGAREGIRAFQETQYLSVDWPQHLVQGESRSFTAARRRR